jgi:hypothetical protein
MIDLRRLSILASLLVPVCSGSAQVPLFTDGTAFGGSKVFSLGMDPRGNACQNTQVTDGFYLTYLRGDAQGSDHADAYTTLQGSQDPFALSGALQTLGQAPWAERETGYGAAVFQKGNELVLTHEVMNGVWVFPDLAPAHLEPTGDMVLNQTRAQGRRDTVDTLSLGGGSAGATYTTGLRFRAERWGQGLQEALLNPPPGVLGVQGAGVDLLDANTTDRRTLAYAVDFGVTTSLAQGVRLGATADHLNTKRLWDVYEQVQVRAGLQMDMGTMGTLSVEQDINQAERMPFPVRQRTGAFSLRLNANSAVTIILGVERTQYEGTDAVVKGGATVMIHVPKLQVGVGMQLSQGRPLMGATAMVQ